MKSTNIVLALDFDGVICDSIDECFLTSYNVYHKKTASISDIPEENRNFFYKYRFYVRPAREYFLIHKAFQQDIKYLDLKIINQLKIKYINEMNFFEKEFYVYRDILKQSGMYWLSLHKVYDHVRRFLRKYQGRFFIVTTKDRNSVEVLSEYFSFHKKILDIFSKEISIEKNKLFAKLFTKHREYLKDKKLFYVDDSEWELANIQNWPLDCFFASWGYTGRQENHSFKSIKNINELFV